MLYRHHFLRIAAGLLFGMTIAFSPKVQGAYAERMGMIESTDKGATWNFKGHADFHAPALNPVDPTALVDNGVLVFYFFNLLSLSADTAVAYRSLAVDGSGLDFSPPVAAFKFAGDFTDPAVVKLPNGKYRMYVAGATAILSATSDDGHTFKQDPGIRTTAGSVPGVLVLPDGKVRLFVCGQGITSLISDNGLDFTPEPGVRIPIPAGAAVVADPDPKRCMDGKFRMAYKIRPSGQGENPTLDEVHLAESADGFSWTVGSTSLVTGSVPTLVEMPDGKLRIYYVDFKQDTTAGLFKLVKTVQVTPDARFLTGTFPRINYIPATDRFVVTFGTKASTKKGDMKGSGYAYKEYTTELQPTAKADTLLWNEHGSESGDSGSTMVGNDYFLVTVPIALGYPYGWRVMKFDAVRWTRSVEKTVTLKSPNQNNADPCVAYVNGRLDISSQYNPDGIWQEGRASHHNFFSLNLDSLDRKILSDTPNTCGASMIYVDGICYFLAADAFDGDVIVMKYDANWKYLGKKVLIQQAHFSTGLVFDGQQFYVAYTSTKLRSVPGFFPVYLNIRLAAFDLDWNPVEDIAVTDYTASDHKQPGRPWVILHNKKLYVSFDCDSVDAATGEEMLRWQAVVKVYELAQGSTSVERSENAPTGFRLEQNFPNPFNPSTRIFFSLPDRQLVTLKVYDLLGREVAVLLNGVKGSGRHTVAFDAANLTSGLYFCRLQAGGFTAARKLTVLK